LVKLNLRNQNSRAQKTNLNKIYFNFRGVASIKNMFDPRSAVHSAPKKCHLAKKQLETFNSNELKI
jgi:hypothetical protein